MGQLAFSEEDRLFDGQCIRFTGRDGKSEVTCGVTITTLKECDPRYSGTGSFPQKHS